ncbi:MAG: hypothetical protein H0V19_03610, partial [Euzebyales bacterium]|nr:hypothetical protein [Euzebyales bacterium]
MRVRRPAAAAAQPGAAVAIERPPRRVIVALGFASLAAAMALQPVLASSQGSLLNVATALFYPVADLTLLAIVIGAFAMSGWRLGRTWWLLASGLVIFTVTDAVYAMLAANQAFTDGMWLDAGWTTGMVLMAVASARHPRLHEHADAGTAALGVPGVAKLAAIGVLVTGAL